MSDFSYVPSAADLANQHGKNTSGQITKGYGQVAEDIIEEANRQGVFIHDSPELVSLLMKLDLDQTIPQELYMVVAELLIWLLDLENQQGSNFQYSGRRRSDK